MFKCLLAFTLFCTVSVKAQNTFDRLKDPENGAVIFKGPVTFADLLSEPSFEWMRKGSEAYQPSPAAVAVLKEKLPGCRIVIVMGTWCEDSQNLIPKLYAVLRQAKVPEKQVLLYGADRAKEAGGDEKARYKITNVPTIILFKEDMEIGRITETVQESVEADLVRILSAAPAR